MWNLGLPELWRTENLGERMKTLSLPLLEFNRQKAHSAPFDA